MRAPRRILRLCHTDRHTCQLHRHILSPLRGLSFLCVIQGLRASRLPLATFWPRLRRYLNARAPPRLRRYLNARAPPHPPALPHGPSHLPTPPPHSVAPPGPLVSLRDPGAARFALAPGYLLAAPSALPQCPRTTATSPL